MELVLDARVSEDRALQLLVEQAESEHQLVMALRGLLAAAAAEAAAAALKLCDTARCALSSWYRQAAGTAHLSSKILRRNAVPRVS